MPTASQVSTFNMGITSAMTQSQFMIEQSHKPNMTNINPVSMNKQQRSGSVSQATSDQKESRELSSTAEWVDNSGKTQSSSHSMDERLWKDVNGLDTVLDWSVDNDVICHHQIQHSQNMIRDTKPEFIASSATDLVCDISSLSSDARYSHQEVDKDLIPGKLSMLDTQWTKS